MERGDSLGLHNLFEQQARRSPEAVAVVDQNSSTTFRDLDRRADLLASRLSDRGIGPGSTVGLGFDHCTEFVVSLLAVLKSGAAFLPLDPSYPSARLAFMVVDSSASLILTHSRFAGAWSATKSVFCLDTDASSTDLSYRNTPAPPVSGDDPAYLIYTSGSTGTPNGVQVSHHAIAQHILSVIRCFGLGPSDRILGFASLSFDAALEQLLGGLVSGATLVFRAPVLPSALELSRFIAKQRITVADLPPSIWVALTETWAKTSATSDATTLRLVIVGGEEMPSSGLKLWREAPLGHIRLFNAYGPTEAVITATSRALRITSGISFSGK